MKDILVRMNQRGQITVPKSLRKHLFQRNTFTIKPTGKGLFLEPIQTRDEFIMELENRAQSKSSPLQEALKRLDKHHGV